MDSLLLDLTIAKRKHFVNNNMKNSASLIRLLRCSKYRGVPFGNKYDFSLGALTVTLSNNHL